MVLPHHLPSSSAVLILAAALAWAFFAGCTPRAMRYARETRSSYISARAVLAEVKEFPSAMEEVLRSRNPEDLPSRAGALIREARDLIPEAASAFRTVKERIDLLRGEGEGAYTSYAAAMQHLVDLNLKVLELFGEFIGLSAAALEGFPYTDNPSNLMPTLNRMDELMAGVEELSSRIASGEEEAESLFRALEE
ncbi:hypothetical protein [Candidatus Solincola tengchongensis]|uniref:hypothetical protein n=1 Tax=Candidatus Solincola tengchongensis TaxID=2900693 RepID=UPI002580A1F2|nr:hypothetical protein [Candidatus Solincola tengchongensis]